MTEKQDKPSAVALARRGDAGEKVIELGENFDRSKVNMLVPTDKVRMISPYHMARMQVVRVSPNPEDGDVFKVGSRKNQRGQWEDVLCPSKVMLLKLSDAAGIIWNTPECKRLDNMQDRDYVAYQAVGGIRLPDGSFRAFKATKEIDMDVIEEEMRLEWDKKVADGKCKAEDMERKLRSELVQFRKHKAARCETGAYNRVIRGLLSLKSQYTATELAKPFVVARIDFAPDYSDPEIRRKMDIAVLSQMQDDFPSAAGCLPVSREEGRQAEREVAEMKAAMPEPDFDGEQESVDVDPDTGEIIDAETVDLDDEPEDGEQSVMPSREELEQMCQNEAQRVGLTDRGFKNRVMAIVNKNNLAECDENDLANLLAKLQEMEPIKQG